MIQFSGYVKAENQDKIDNLYVMGCLSERYMDALKHEIPEVKRYFGVNNMTDVLNELGLGLRKDLLTDKNNNRSWSLCIS